jgi:multidrug efflux system membrane fusion protein
VVDDIPNALVVPRDAVNDGPDGPYVYVVADGRAVVHRVKVLFDDSQFVAVEADINPGDAVVTEGQLQVIADGPVRVIPADDAAAVPVERRGRGARPASKKDSRQIALDPK